MGGLAAQTFKLGRILKALASLPCFVLLVLLVAAAKILAVEVDTHID